MAQVTLHKLVKNYDDTPAVRGIDLNIADKEFVVLVGPSGCGKSTTLRMIAGLEEITGGDIMIGNEVVNDVPPKDRDIAMVFQNYALYPHMTVYENMSFGLRLKKMANLFYNYSAFKSCVYCDLLQRSFDCVFNNLCTSCFIAS